MATSIEELQDKFDQLSEEVSVTLHVLLEVVKRQDTLISSIETIGQALVRANRGELDMADSMVSDAQVSLGKIRVRSS